MTEINEQTQPSMPPAAWYPDPADQSRLRYWDGSAWTDHVAVRAASESVAQDFSAATVDVADTSVPAGWYPNPEDEMSIRYWDGQGWTEHTAPRFAESAPGSSAQKSGRNVGWSLFYLSVAIAALITLVSVL